MTAADPILAFFPNTSTCPRAYRLLRAASERAGRELDTPPALADISPLGEVLEHAINAKMSCLLADWLIRHGHTDALPRPMQQFLRGLLRLNAYRSRAHHHEATRIVAALHAHGIPAAAINGIAHATTLYPPGLRQSSDVDILVPANAAATAVDVLTTLGYDSTGRRTTALHRDFDDPLVPGLTLDLTTRLAHTDDPAAIQDILARRVPAAHGGGDPLPILHRDDGFTHTLARVAAQRRWPALADALRYAVDGTDQATATSTLPPQAQQGWGLVRACWPQLAPDVPLARSPR